jgi:hypothetical protein
MAQIADTIYLKPQSEFEGGVGGNEHSNPDSGLRSKREESEATRIPDYEVRRNQKELERFKYIKLNNTSYCITQLFQDLEWMVKTVNFTKSFSDYLVYCTDLKRALDIETPVETDNLILLEKPPFLKYKEYVKEKYRNIVYVLKQVHKNTLLLPDAEKVSLTISKDFNMENDLFFKNPEFIIDHFIYHIYSHNHISENYEKVITLLKAFEYLYYKTLNYVNELEFDILSDGIDNIQ